jgi:hypothetical protein
MSKFLKIVSQFNHLLKEDEQVDSNLASLPTGAQGSEQSSGETSTETPVEPEQISDEEQSALTINKDQLRNFLQAFQSFLKKTYNGTDKEDLISTLNNTDDDVILNTFEEITNKLNPASAGSQNPALVKNAGSSD